ncbi:unnamed protein product, partial [Mesorhabditis spiculigera]
MDGSTALDGLPFSGNFQDPRDTELSDYDRERKPHKAHNDQSAPIKMTVRTLQNELLCPICLDLLTKTMTTKECLHRFCQECITTALQRGNKECPTCRKKLVSKRSLRPDPNFDRLIEKIWPDRKIYDDMQSKQAEIFTQHSSMDALREGIFDGVKAQAVHRRQRVPGSYDVGDIPEGRGKKRKKEGEIKHEPAENGDRDGSPTSSSHHGHDGGQMNGEHGENGTPTQNGHGEGANPEEPSLTQPQSHVEEVYDEHDYKMWVEFAEEEKVEEIPNNVGPNGIDLDLYSDNSTFTTDSNTSYSSNLTVSSVHESPPPPPPPMKPETSGIRNRDSTPLPPSPDKSESEARIPAWLDESSTGPPTPDESGHELVRNTEDDLLEVTEQDPEIEIELLPAGSLSKRSCVKPMLLPRYLKTRYDTTMSHLADYLHAQVIDDTTAFMLQTATPEDKERVIASIERPEYFYVLNSQSGHHIKRIFLHETIHVAHGSATRNEHLMIFFDTKAQLRCCSEKNLLEAIVPKLYLDQPATSF